MRRAGKASARGNSGSERESAHKLGLEASERRAANGRASCKVWSRWEPFHHLRSKNVGLVPLAWCRVNPCRGRLPTKAAPTPLHDLKTNGKKGTEEQLWARMLNGTAVKMMDPCSRIRGVRKHHNGRLHGCMGVTSRFPRLCVRIP